MSLAWRYVGEVEIDDASPDPDLGDPDAMPELWVINDIDKIDAYNWFDLAVSYLMKNGIRWTVGVNNIFDEEPPLAPTFNDDFGVNLYRSTTRRSLRLRRSPVQFLRFILSTIGGPFGAAFFVG